MKVYAHLPSWITTTFGIALRCSLALLRLWSVSIIVGDEAIVIIVGVRFAFAVLGFCSLCKDVKRGWKIKVRVAKL